MKLHILGSGSILSDVHRNQAGYVIEENGHKILLDAGPGILRRLGEYGFDVLLLEGIVISHFHLDHCSDVFPILMKRHLSSPGANLDFFIAGSQGLSHWFNQMAGLQGEWLNAHPPKQIDFSGKPFFWNDVRIASYPTEHTKDSIAIRFESQRTLFFSSDTDFSEELAGFASGAEVGIAECSHSETNKVKGHMIPSETGRFATLAGFEHLIATHLYPENEYPGLKDQLAKYFSGKITIARDGLSVPI